jgi:hypothetical protein
MGPNMNRNSKLMLSDRGGRVIVTVDAESHLPPTIELAVAVAAATESVLHGLFVEDIDLLSVANLPFSQEVPLIGGRPRSLDNQQLQRSLDKFSRDFRQALENQAERFALRCSYSVVRGRKQSMELGDLAPAEFLILGQPLRGSSRAVGLQRILLLGNHSDLLVPALKVILEKTRGLHTELLLTAEPGPGSNTLPPALVELLGRHPDVVPVMLPPDRLQQVLVTRSPAADCVIASRQLGAAKLGRILSLASCPVIVAGAAPAVPETAKTN